MTARCSKKRIRRCTTFFLPDVARTMTAMLEEVIRFGTGIAAKPLGRPAAGKTGTTQDYTDAWFVGYTPQLTAGVWVGFDDKQISLGKKETAHAPRFPSGSNLCRARSPESQ